MDHQGQLSFFSWLLIDPATIRQVTVRRLAKAAAQFISRVDGAIVTPYELDDPTLLLRPERPHDGGRRRRLDDVPLSTGQPAAHRRTRKRLCPTQGRRRTPPRHATHRRPVDRRDQAPPDSAT